MFWKTRPRTWLWLNLVTASTVIFWLSDWDMRIADLFYRQPEYWLLDDFPLWKTMVYDGVPYVSGAVLAGTLAVVVSSTLARRWYRARLYAIYVLLVFVLGPGLFVNALFKDNWGRPRPVQVEQLGGHATYVPPVYFVADGEGRSFPSGHSSVGFAFIAFWFLWRKQRPQWANTALVAAILSGSVIGLTRMAAGGHFLSDVIWSAWVVLFVAWLLYYPLLRIPDREQH